MSNNTVRLELAVFSHLFNTMRTEWSMPMTNHVADIKLPKPGRPRDRRLRGDEEVQLLSAAKNSKAPDLACCIQLAIATGMRVGEIVGLTEDMIDLQQQVIFLQLTKNGDARIVPLTEVAVGILHEQLELSRSRGRMFSFYDAAGVSRAFGLVCKRVGIKGLTFHDLRHEAASRFAPRMTVATLAKAVNVKVVVA